MVTIWEQVTIEVRCCDIVVDVEAPSTLSKWRAVAVRRWGLQLLRSGVI